VNVVASVLRYLPKGGSLPLDVWQKRHRAMVTLLWLHVPSLFIVGVVTNHGTLHVLMECSILAACGLIAMREWPRRDIPMVATTFGLLTASALLVHFSGGVIEMHFHFFVIVAAVTLYQAWVPFIVAIGYVVGQHTIIGVLDPSSVYNHPAAVANPGKWAFVHGLFILGESVTLLIAWRLNEDARGAAETAYQKRLQEEEARREAQEHYRLIFDNALEGIYECTIEGSIVTANPALARILGFETPHHLIESGPIMNRYADPADRPRFLGLLERDGSVSGFEFQARRADGSIVWLSNTASAVLDDDGSIIGVQGMVDDITERKEAEESRVQLESQLRHAQKMDALGQLAGGVAHDFNNLLFVIQNYARFGMEGLAEDDPRAEDLTEVLNASQRGADLVRQLLAFSRKDDISPEVLDINEAITETGKILRRTLGEHIELELELDPDLHLVEIDAGHLQQVVMNLAINAQDAMPRGGRLSISTTNVAIDDPLTNAQTVAAGDYVLLCFRDTGTGMEAGVVEHIFEPFFTTKEVGEGTGLGLATVYGIVEQCDGSITVDSEPGVGTEFKIYLPANAATFVSSRPSQEMRPAATGSATVLVVEDDASVLQLIRRILSGSGFEVLSTGSVDEALALMAGDDPFDLLLTDLVMPGTSGVELADQAKSLRPDLPVVFMSGYSTDVLTRHGAVDNVELLMKPFSSTDLIDHVHRALLRENTAA